MSSPPPVGIDLGTTNSLIAVFGEEGPELVPGVSGKVLTPSAVGLSDAGEVLVGEAALSRLVTHPALTAARFKRLMGTDKTIKLGERGFRPEELSALVLRALLDDAEAFLGVRPERAVISVPAYFNDIQRKATLAAAELAGLRTERLVNEPTAAALAYGLQDREAESVFLVVDLGGGTFDVSLLEMFEGVMEVRASAGDAFLGGEDFTDALAAHFAKGLGLKPSEMPPADRSRLRAAADAAKRRLSETPEAETPFRNGEAVETLAITRDAFETLSEPLLARLRQPIQRAIADAGLRASEVDRVLLVGGATRMPVVRTAITRLFRRFPEFDLDPDRVVALGAAVQAGLAARHAALEDMVMTDVAPFTLGFATTKQLAPERFEDGHFSPLIERNTVVPASRVDTIYPVRDNQRQVTIEVYQGEAPFVSSNIKLGTLDVKLPKSGGREEKGIQLRYTYDTSGVLEVTTLVEATGETGRLVIESQGGALTPKEIETRLKALENLKIHPRDQLENAELLARLSAAFENALGWRREVLGNLIAQFQSALETQDRRLAAEARERIAGELASLGDDDVFS